MDKEFENFESEVDYNTVLDDFEGPLDLLLHLINIAKIRIEDIFVSQVTGQFLNYIEFMKTQPSRNVDKESAYLALAAQIIYIKSKSLLPVIEIAGEEMGGAEAEKQELIEQLKQREYELIKSETPKLKDLETIGYYFKEPDNDFSKVKIVYTEFSLNSLLEAFGKLMLRNESLSQKKDDIKEIPKDAHTVEEKVYFIREKLLTHGEVKFFSLFVTYSRNEIVTTFQALLEMLKNQFINIKQDGLFGDITITVNPLKGIEDISNGQFDEDN